MKLIQTIETFKEKMGKSKMNKEQDSVLAMNSKGKSQIREKYKDCQNKKKLY